MTNLLKVTGLSVEFYPGDPTRSFHAVKEANFSVKRGEMVGMVGESGCGKSVASLSLLNLLPDTARAAGEMNFMGEEYTPGRLSVNKLRGQRIGMIFQEPMTALNPVFSVGELLKEALRYQHGWSDQDRLRSEALTLLDRVQLDRPEQRLGEYPHELSGGQRQRAMIALALTGKPDLLIADEPTTALDVTLQQGIMKLFRDLADQGLGVLMISHDLALVGEVSDRTVVMYSGYTVESGSASRLTQQPQHPYSIGLMASSQAVFERGKNRLPVIEGEVPSPRDRPAGCPFHPRCPEREERCDQEFPPVFEPIEGIKSACWARESKQAKELVEQSQEFEIDGEDDRQ